MKSLKMLFVIIITCVAIKAKSQNIQQSIPLQQGIHNGKPYGPVTIVPSFKVDINRIDTVRNYVDKNDSVVRVENRPVNQWRPFKNGKMSPWYAVVSNSSKDTLLVFKRVGATWGNHPIGKIPVKAIKNIVMQPDGSLVLLQTAAALATL